VIELAFDIETIADPLIDPELELMLFQKLDNAEVKLGNVKDPDKIKAKLAEKAFEAEQKKQELKSEYGLSPLTGRIACISVFSEPEDPLGINPAIERSFIDVDEKKLLDEFWKFVRPFCKQGIQWISFNGKSFDANYIRVRTAKNKIVGSLVIPTYKYEFKNHFDVRDVLSNYDNKAKGTLDQWSAFWGQGTKIAHGDAVQAMWDKKEFDKIAEYCLDDAKKTFRIKKQLEDYV